MLRIVYNSCNIKVLQEIKVLNLRPVAANFLIIAPVLIEMSLWITILPQYLSICDIPTYCVYTDIHRTEVGKAATCGTSAIAEVAVRF